MKQTTENYLQGLEFEFLLERASVLWRQFGREDCAGNHGDYCINSDNYGFYALQIGVNRRSFATESLVERTGRILNQLRGVWRVNLFDWGTLGSSEPFLTIKSSLGGIELESPNQPDKCREVK